VMTAMGSDRPTVPPTRFGVDDRLVAATNETGTSARNNLVRIRTLTWRDATTLWAGVSRRDLVADEGDVTGHRIHTQRQGGRALALRPTSGRL